MNQRQPSHSDRELVIVLHGFGAHRLWMVLLCRRLRRQGYRVENWGYRSLFRRIETHGERLFEDLTVRLADEPQVHIVAHSMGSIVTRFALSLGKVPNLGRVVLLAPPNRGILFARVASTVVGWPCRCLRQISSRSDSFANQLPQEVAAEIGVLAGRFDWLVPPSRTHFDQQADHRVILADHNSLLVSQQALELTVAFLSHGKF